MQRIKEVSRGTVIAVQRALTLKHHSYKEVAFMFGLPEEVLDIIMQLNPVTLGLKVELNYSTIEGGIGL